MIATLYQARRGLTTSQAQILDNLLTDKHLLFIGYSGNDFDIYPKILSMADTAKGIYWNLRSEKPPGSIQRLFNAYQDKAVSIVMDLRDLLEQLAEGLNIDYHKPPHPSQESQERFHQFLNKWAQGMSGDRAAITIGEILEWIGRLAGARRCYRQALKIAREMGDLYQEESRALTGIGRVFRRKGDLGEALRYHQDALKAQRERDNDEREPYREANVLNDIGLVYHNRGDLKKALRCLQDSLNIHRETGDNEGEASALDNIGLIYRDRGDLKKALRCLQDSLNIHRETGDNEGEASVLNNIGLIYRDRGDLEKALRYYQDALKIFTEIGAKLQMDSVTKNIRRIRTAIKYS